MSLEIVKAVQKAIPFCFAFFFSFLLFFVKQECHVSEKYYCKSNKEYILADVLMISNKLHAVSCISETF